MIYGKTIPEVSFPSEECPKPTLWSCYDSEATEIEVLNFLASLIRMIKPEVVLETGTYHGFGTAHMAEAVRDNGFGHIYSAEIDQNCVFKARKFLSENGLDEFTTVVHNSGVELINILTKVDFAFLDSDFRGIRVQELKAVYPKLSKSAIVAVHDTSTYHIQNKGPRLEVVEAAKQLGMQLIQFDTPRGLSLLRR